MYTLILALGGILVASGWINLVNLSVGVEEMNALLLPIVLGFLYLLVLRTLPKEFRLKPADVVIAGIILLVTIVFGLFGGISGII